jgi:predicted small integral membrane protein
MPSKTANELAERESATVQDEAGALVAPVQKTGRKGFLPMTTNLWDRFFISMVCLVAIHLLWMRFVEQPLQQFLPHPFALLVATVISVILGFFIMTKG